MGFITQSDEIITNVSTELNNILSSPMTQNLQLGTPILVTYFNSSNLGSTTDNGLDTVDSILGPDSPIRYNKIEGLPVYGMLRNFVIDLENDEGLIDMKMTLDDLTLLPNTVVPTPYDHIVYEFSAPIKRVLVFRVTEIKKTSIKSHYFEQFSAKLEDIDSYGYVEKLESQVVKRFAAKLDNFGTEEKCILEYDQYKFSNEIDKIIHNLIDQYVDTFYSKKYLSLIFTGELEQGYISYDPWLTHFCITNKILLRKDDYAILVNHDYDENNRKKYNSTFYHALETKSLDRFKPLLFTPVPFSKVASNPFSYYAEDVAFKIDIYDETEIKYPRNMYTDFPFIQSIIKKTGESPRYTIIENIIIRFFEKESLVNNITDADIYKLQHDIFIEADGFSFRVIPMLIYCLSTFNDDVMKAYA